MKNKKALAGIFLALSLTTLSGCVKGLTPTIKEGRFNFSITYEVDGTVETISSVYVCKYKKTISEVDGWSIVWEEYIEDSEVVARLEENCSYMILETNDDGTIYLDLNLHAVYFMAEPGYSDLDGSKPNLYIQYNEEASEMLGTNGDSDPEVLESYGVKIISYEYDAPIENVYE